MVEHEFRVGRYELLVASWKVKSTSWDSKVRVQIYELRVQIHKSSNPQVASSNLPVTCSNPRVTSSNPWLMRSNPRVANLNLQAMSTISQVTSLNWPIKFKSASSRIIKSMKTHGNSPTNYLGSELISVAYLRFSEETCKVWVETIFFSRIILN